MIPILFFFVMAAYLKQQTVYMVWEETPSTSLTIWLQEHRLMHLLMAFSDEKTRLLLLLSFPWLNYTHRQ